MNEQLAEYTRVMQDWQRLLDQADPSDVEQIAYLKDKLSAATAVVERRQQMSTGVAAVAGFDLVSPDDACTCGERRMDWLMWLSDGINVKCHSCGTIFRPGGAR